jgi:hypothetical protein
VVMLATIRSRTYCLFDCCQKTQKLEYTSVGTSHKAVLLRTTFDVTSSGKGSAHALPCTLAGCGKRPFGAPLDGGLGVICRVPCVQRVTDSSA